MNPVPVLLERDYNFDNLKELQGELMHLKGIVNKYWEVEHEAKGSNS